jgi:polygalacturonase
MEPTKLITIACLVASNQESNVFDPKAYGAVGDGVTTDTAAFAAS